MTERVLFGPGGATEINQDEIILELQAILSTLQEGATPETAIIVLQAIRDVLNTTLVVEGEVSLDAASLAALEATTATVANFPADYPDVTTLAKLEQIRGVLMLPLGVTGPLTNTELRTASVLVADDYTDDVFMEDQTGADGVLTFTLGQPVKLVAVDIDPVDLGDTAAYIARATVDGTTPTETLGWRCRAGQATFLPVPCSGTVKVWAPTGVTVSVEAGVR